MDLIPEGVAQKKPGERLRWVTSIRTQEAIHLRPNGRFLKPLKKVPGSRPILGKGTAYLASGKKSYSGVIHFLSQGKQAQF